MGVPGARRAPGPRRGPARAMVAEAPAAPPARRARRPQALAACRGGRRDRRRRRRSREWRRAARAARRTEQPAETLREAVDIVAAGYRERHRPRERAVQPAGRRSALTFGVARLSTCVDPPPRHARARFATSGSRDRHVHHFVPGIVMAFLAGGVVGRVARRALDAVAGAAVRRGRRADARRVGAAARARRRLLVRARAS